MINDTQKYIDGFTQPEKIRLYGKKRSFRFPSESSIKVYTNTMLKLLFFLMKTEQLQLELFFSDESLDLENYDALNLSIGKKIADIVINKGRDIYDFVLLLGIRTDDSLRSPQEIRSNIPHILFYIRICICYVKSKASDYLPQDWLKLFDPDVIPLY
jgi:hypothetical protein